MRIKIKAKSVLVVMALLLVIATTKAQEQGTSEIKIGYGTLSTNEIIDIFSDVISYTFIDPSADVTTSNSVYNGCFYLSYSYAIKNKWVVGADLVYELITKDVNSKDRSSNKTEKIGEEDNVHYTLGLKTNYNYISKPIFRLYSGASIGYTVKSAKFKPSANASSDVIVTKSNENGFNFQINALGVRIGKKFAGHAEFGFGYKGLLSAGLNYQF